MKLAWGMIVLDQLWYFLWYRAPTLYDSMHYRHMTLQAIPCEISYNIPYNIIHLSYMISSCHDILVQLYHSSPNQWIMAWYHAYFAYCFFKPPEFFCILFYVLLRACCCGNLKTSCVCHICKLFEGSQACNIFCSSFCHFPPYYLSCFNFFFYICFHILHIFSRITESHRFVIFFVMLCILNCIFLLRHIVSRVTYLQVFCHIS